MLKAIWKNIRSFEYYNVTGFQFQLDIYLPNLIVITMDSAILQYQRTD